MDNRIPIPDTPAGSVEEGIGSAHILLPWLATYPGQRNVPRLLVAHLPAAIHKRARQHRLHMSDHMGLRRRQRLPDERKIGCAPEFAS